mgnify:CR=1 FL=1
MTPVQCIETLICCNWFYCPRIFTEAHPAAGVGPTGTQVLGVPQDATLMEIKAAFKQVRVICDCGGHEGLGWPPLLSILVAPAVAINIVLWF